MGVGVGLEINEELPGMVALTNRFAVDPDLFFQRFFTLQVICGGTPFITEQTDLHSVTAFPVRTCLRDRNTDLVYLDAEALPVVLAQGTIRLAMIKTDWISVETLQAG